MTYRELKTLLEKLTEVQLDCTVTVYITDSNELVSVDMVSFYSSEHNTLEEGTPILNTVEETNHDKAKATSLQKSDTRRNSRKNGEKGTVEAG